MHPQRITVLCLPFLLACVGRPAPGEAPPSGPEPGRTPREALALTLATVDELSKEEREIRLRRIDSRLDRSAGEAPPSVVIQLDVDFLASDELEATRLEERLVQALRDRGACGEIGASASRALDSGRGISCDGFAIAWPAPCPVHAPSGDPRTREASEEAHIRTAAVHRYVNLGQLDISKRSLATTDGEWLSFRIEPGRKNAAHPLANLLNFAQALEEGPGALAVTEIRLRPGDHVLPGGDAVLDWTFTIEAGRPQG